mgnify:CR=1 FL=1
MIAEVLPEGKVDVIEQVAGWVAQHGSLDDVVFLVGLAVFAGAVVAFQAAFNGRVSVATGQPTVAGLVNFIVGLTALLVVFTIQRAVRGDVLHAECRRTWLDDRVLAGDEVAKSIQLVLEYDPQPPFDAGSPCSVGVNQAS